MSGNENVSNQQYPGAVFNRGHQGGGGAEFFNSLPSSQPAGQFNQPQLPDAPGQQPSLMNPAFQPQGPPVFYNPMDYQKPLENSLPVTNSWQQEGQQQQHHPPTSNGMDGYHQNWNKSAAPADYTNHYPNGAPSHDESRPGPSDHSSDGGAQGWFGASQGSGETHQSTEAWNYHNPYPTHNQHIETAQGYPQQQQQQPYQTADHPSHDPSSEALLPEAQSQAAHTGYSEEHHAPTNPQLGHGIEADSESVSSGGGFSGFFNDRDEDDVDLVHPKGKETGRESSASMGLSGPDIIPATTQEIAAEQRNTDHTTWDRLEGAAGGMQNQSHIGLLPDLGQRPNNHGDIPQPPFGANPVNNNNEQPWDDRNNRNDLNPLYAGAPQEQDSGVLEPHPSMVGNPPGMPAAPSGTTDGAHRTNISEMPELVKQSSPGKPEILPDEGESQLRQRSQSSDLVSDIQGAIKGPIAGGPSPVDPEISSPSLPSPLSSLPSVTSGSGDPGDLAPPPDHQSLSPREQDVGENPSMDGAPRGGEGTENHPDLSASVPLAGHAWKPDLTNIDQVPLSPTGPSSLSASLPVKSDIDTSHTSAFRSISGRHTPKQTPIVNPSQPLWSTGVPPVAGNILLAPALSQPSIMPVLHPSPVKLHPRTASSMVTHPSGPAPVRATAEALGPGGHVPVAPIQHLVPPATTSGDSVAERLGALHIGTSNPPRAHHNGTNGQSNQLPTEQPSSDQQAPREPAATVPPTSQPTFEFGRPYQLVPPVTTVPVTSQSAVPTQAQSTSSAEPVQPGTGVQPSQVAQGADLQQQQQVMQQGNPQPGQGNPQVRQGNPQPLQGAPGAPGQHQQYPPYGGPYDPRYAGYQGGYDRYRRTSYGQRYDPAAQTPEQQYQQQPQYGRHSPYKQGPGWYGDRPPSRQGWGQQQQGSTQPENYNYQRYYKDREEYARRDEYYRQWYQQQRGAGGGWPQKWWRAEDYQRYYARARQAQQAREGYSKEEGDQSGEYRDQPGDNIDSGNRTNLSGSFTSDFHHTGGGTPEGYGADQSKIQGGRYQQATGYGVQQGDGSYLQDGSYSQGYDSYGQELNSYPEQTQTATPPPPERTTPSKFGIAHIVARFSPGGHLIKVLPNTPADGMPATVEIHRVEDMLEESDEVIELKSFPGPLLRGETHKSDVIRFATQKAKDATSSTALSDRESVALLWELMELLCRQNGTVLETDISEMLLKVHSSQSDGESETGEAGSSEGPTVPPARNIQKDTEEFRRLLLYGRKKESLEFAIKAKLWGHALLLAGKMDARTHASVMTRFANSLAMNDPLQTLYQLMSDRQPAAVTSCADERWGDWRPHLAMILSNLSTSDSAVGIRSITALGDSLATRGLLHASHFCYLMAQVGFGPYTHKATKIVLLGSSHSLPFTDFATNMAIQLTEVYEYAQLLGNRHYLLPNFQAYKFLYATRLAGHGMLEQALHYCEVVAGSIMFKPEHYSSTLVQQVCELSHRLKYHDIQYYDGSHLTEPQWLTDLQGILHQMRDGTIQPPSKSETPIPWVESQSNLSTIEGGSSEGQTPSTDGQPQYPTTEYHDQYQYDQQWGQQQQQWGQQQYQEQGGHGGSEGAEPTPTSVGSQGFSYNPEDVSHQDQGYTHQQWQYGEQHNQQYQGEPDLAASANSNFSEYSTTAGTETAGETTDYGESMTSQKGFDYYGQSVPGNRADTADTTTGTANHRQRTQSGSTHKSRSRTVSGSSNRSEGKHKEKSGDSSKTAAKAPEGGGGWFSGIFNKIRARNGKEVHLPDDSKQEIVWDSTKQKWVNSLGGEDDDSVPQGPPPSDHELSKQQQPQPGAPSSMGPPAPPLSSNKFSSKNLRGGRYVDVNKDSTAPVAPVPLLAPLHTAPPGPVNFYIPDSDNKDQPQQAGNPDSEPATLSNSQAVPEQSAPQFFNPASYAAPTSTQAPSSQPQQQQFLAPPQMQQENLSHASSMSSLSEEVSHLTNQTVKEAPQPVSAAPAPAAPAVTAPPLVPGAPLMFNPTQMAQPASFPTPGASKPSRYGARRQYPAPR